MRSVSRSVLLISWTSAAPSGSAWSPNQRLRRFPGRALAWKAMSPRPIPFSQVQCCAVVFVDHSSADTWSPRIPILHRHACIIIILHRHACITRTPSVGPTQETTLQHRLQKPTASLESRPSLRQRPRRARIFPASASSMVTPVFTSPLISSSPGKA